jgi:hypothetical protein
MSHRQGHFGHFVGHVVILIFYKFCFKLGLGPYSLLCLSKT